VGAGTVGAYVPILSQCDGNGLGAASNFELAEDSLDVRRDRLRADHERRRNLFPRLSIGEEREDLALARAEIRPRRDLPVAWPLALPLGAGSLAPASLSFALAISRA